MPSKPSSGPRPARLALSRSASPGGTYQVAIQTHQLRHHGTAHSSGLTVGQAATAARQDLRDLRNSIDGWYQNPPKAAHWTQNIAKPVASTMCDRLGIAGNDWLNKRIPIRNMPAAMALFDIYGLLNSFDPKRPYPNSEIRDHLSGIDDLMRKLATATRTTGSLQAKMAEQSNSLMNKGKGRDRRGQPKTHTNNSLPVSKFSTNVVCTWMWLGLRVR